MIMMMMITMMMMMIINDNNNNNNNNDNNNNKRLNFWLCLLLGNHGEDVKECYYYLDSTPTHSYMKALYKYPQAQYPYEQLIRENKARSKMEPEFELSDAGGSAVCWLLIQQKIAGTKTDTSALRTDRQRNRQTDKQTDKQTNRQTNI